MAEHFHHFISDGSVLTLPVTPSSYVWTWGKNIETVNISAIGDAYFPGNVARHTGKIECMFPAHDYSWLAPGAYTDPRVYVSRFSIWSQADTVVRYIVDGTDINAQVLIESIHIEEKDGSEDVYATILLREWVDVEAASVATPDSTAGTQNGRQSQETGSRSYTIVSGDMLSVICRRYYGDGSAKYYNALAAYNGIQNPHLIYPGNTITIPPASELFGG